MYLVKKTNSFFTDVPHPNGVQYYYIYGEYQYETNGDTFEGYSQNGGQTVQCNPSLQLVNYYGVDIRRDNTNNNRIELRRGDDLVFLVTDSKPTIEKVVKLDPGSTIKPSYVLLSDGNGNDIMRVITKSNDRRIIFGGYNALASGYAKYMTLGSGGINFNKPIVGGFSVETNGSSSGQAVSFNMPIVVSGSSTESHFSPGLASPRISAGNGLPTTSYNYYLSVGTNNSILNSNTVALGEHLNVTTKYCTVVGRYNASNEAYFIVGNGTSYTNKRNAFVVNTSGDITVLRNASIGGGLTANTATISGYTTIGGDLSVGGSITDNHGYSLEQTYLNASLAYINSNDALNRTTAISYSNQKTTITNNLEVTGEITCGGYDFTYMMSTVNGNSTNIYSLQTDVSNLNTSVSTAQNRADNAYNLADSANTSANTALTKTTDISYANNETTVANDLVVNGDLKVGASGSEVNVITEINTAKASATQAASDAATALSTANTADTNASTALTDAATAQGAALTALTRTTNIHVDDQTNNTVVSGDTEMEGDLTVGANVASATLNVNGDANISGTATVTGNVIANNIPALPAGIADGDIYVLKATIADVSGVLTPTFTWVKEN